MIDYNTFIMKCVCVCVCVGGGGGGGDNLSIPQSSKVQPLKFLFE